MSADRLDEGKIAHQQGTDPGWPAELVSGQGDQVGIGKRELGRALGAVGEKQPSRSPNLIGDAVEGLDHASLVIGMLDRNERAIALDRVEINDPVPADR